MSERSMQNIGIGVGGVALTVDQILELLPQRARAYRAAVISEDLLTEERCRIDLCSVFEYLLEVRLGRCHAWELVAWVDGVLPGTLDISESGVVSVAGQIVWSGNK